ncbi:alpha/beta fold hydrolase [Priestia taiwanensis]|uniref:Ndr family protein n=1 Tax=Priestia taiwanensis TaxID=1347902 RepID=A0A917EMP4_9BACI|nr:alpha/beta hydrolase [Priestia taiwanensis]MBM7361827.1 pimeloyl-ACP methyl ester carboxylesterase [Priestia taiwanensis]GGE57269.1 Ndr family protein [Priestia taiwanensis]
MRVAFKSAEGQKEILSYYESLVEKSSVPHEKIIIDTRYGKTFIMDSGKEDLPPLILLHGSGMNSVMWVHELVKYARHYRVYAVDMPGEPGRSSVTQLPFEGDDFTNWLYNIFDVLSIETASIVGISLGAWLGTKFSIKYPPKVNKLVLLCPAGIGPQKKSFMFKSLFYMLAGEKGIEKLYYRINGDKHIPKEILTYQKLITKHFNFRKETIPLFSDDELRKLTISVALFVGAKDIMIHSAKTAKRLKSLVEYATINVLPDEGHSLVNQGEAIREFLNETCI